MKGGSITDSPSNASVPSRLLLVSPFRLCGGPIEWRGGVVLSPCLVLSPVLCCPCPLRIVLPCFVLSSPLFLFVWCCVCVGGKVWWCAQYCCCRAVVLSCCRAVRGEWEGVVCYEWRMECVIVFCSSLLLFPLLSLCSLSQHCWLGAVSLWQGCVIVE